MRSHHIKYLLLAIAALAAETIASRGPPNLAVAADALKMGLPPQSSPPSGWVAAGPGRIEPISGEIRISAPTAGLIEDLVVRVRDKVAKGALLAVIDDSEQRARVRAAEAEVEFREAERETSASSALPNARRSAEDTVASAEREAWRAQETVDQLVVKHSRAGVIDAAQAAWVASEAHLNEARRALDVVLASADAARPSRTESALAVARAELGVAQAALEKTRVRAPREGSILHVGKSAGDMASAAPDDVLVAMGDITRLQCKVELDENDTSNIAVGQRVFLRSDAFPHLDFRGAVAVIGASARPRQLSAPMSQQTAKDNALEVTVELEASTPLIPGMRVDAFFESTNFANGTGESNGSK